MTVNALKKNYIYFTKNWRSLTMVWGITGAVFASESFPKRRYCSILTGSDCTLTSYLSAVLVQNERKLGRWPPTFTYIPWITGVCIVSFHGKSWELWPVCKWCISLHYSTMEINSTHSQAVGFAASEEWSWLGSLHNWFCVRNLTVINSFFINLSTN